MFNNQDYVLRKKMCIRDSIIIHPETGDVLICDNDNVAPEGVTSGILGKARYMAPELSLIHIFSRYACYQRSQGIEMQFQNCYDWYTC